MLLPALPRQLQARDEAGGARGLPEARILRLRQEAFDPRPFDARAQQPLDPKQRLLQGHHRSSRHDMHGRLGPRPDQAIGGDEVVKLGLPRRSEAHTSALQSLMRISYAVCYFTNNEHPNNTQM